MAIPYVFLNDSQSSFNMNLLIRELGHDRRPVIILKNSNRIIYYKTFDFTKSIIHNNLNQIEYMSCVIRDTCIYLSKGIYKYNYHYLSQMQLKYFETVRNVNSKTTPKINPSCVLYNDRKGGWGGHWPICMWGCGEIR